MSYIEKLDQFAQKMMEDYAEHRIYQGYSFKPFFDWKQGKRGCNFTRQELVSMRRSAKRLIEMFDKKYPEAWEQCDFTENDDLFSPYRGYGEDARNVAYYNAIEEELTNFLILRMD